MSQLFVMPFLGHSLRWRCISLCHKGSLQYSQNTELVLVILAIIFAGFLVMLLIKIIISSKFSERNSLTTLASTNLFLTIAFLFYLFYF